METLGDVLSFYDNPTTKRFAYHEVVGRISELPEEIKNSQEAQSEILAFSFQDNTGQNHWGTYLGPMTVWRRKDNGEEVLLPNYHEIKAEDIHYWEKRLFETYNPVMKMRYAGLVFDFGKKVTNVEPSYNDIKLPYVNAIIDVITGNYVVYPTEGYIYADRAIEVTLKIKNEDLLQKVQAALWNYDKQYEDAIDKPGLWGSQFKIMIKYMDKYSAYEQLLVDENEKRFSFLENRAKELGGRKGNEVHLMSNVADMLCEYYHKKSDINQIENHIDRYLDVVRLSFPFRGGMWAQAMLQSVQARYRKYNLEKKANRLYIDIQDLGQSALNDMTPHQYSIPLDQEQIEKYLSDFLSGSAQNVYTRFVYCNIPDITIERQRQREEAEQFPLSDLMRTTSYDSSGSPISNIGAGKNAEHEKLMYGMYRRMLISSFFLRMEIEKMIEKGMLTKDVIMDTLKDTPLIVSGQKKIIERGLDAYFDNDYLVACHLLIPQFESAIRRLVLLSGGNVLRPQKNPVEGNEYISLDGLLNSEEVKNCLDESIILYFKNLFTEQNGWNLRNLTCHGLLSADSFNSRVADRVIHALAMLGQIKRTSKSTENVTLKSE